MSADKEEFDPLMSEIFGSDDEAPPAPRPAVALDSDNESLFGSSDNEAPKPRKKLARTKDAASEELQDSDDDAKQPARQNKRKKKRLLGDKEQKRIKRSAKEREPKRNKDKDPDGKDPTDSGNDYDSGEEAARTKEDDDFIAEDDDHADLIKEYDEDNQNFDDEQPHPSQGKGKVRSHSSSAADSSGRGSRKDDDPLSLTLAAMKAPKAKPLTAAEQEAFVDKLQRKMEHAKALDDTCYAQQQPATHKLQLLPMVKQAVAMRALHNTMLERDFLCTLRDWIKPRGSELPSLSLRTTVYEMLRDLPCLTEHLKRGRGDEPVGFVVVRLRKHAAETVENKRLLKEIMDKWSRPAYGNSVDTRSGASALHHDEEVQLALAHKYRSQAAGAAPAGSDFGRARIPLGVGFLYTVQPESKVGDGKAEGRGLDENRSKLLKTVMDGKRGKGEAGVGKKVNPRAVSLSVNGKNVSL